MHDVPGLRVVCPCLVAAQPVAPDQRTNQRCGWWSRDPCPPITAHLTRLTPVSPAAPLLSRHLSSLMICRCRVTANTLK